MNESVLTSTQIFLSGMKDMLRSLARRVEMDRAVLYALLAKIWSFAAGPITVILIATHFTPAMQGFYFTFGSILALQVFAELGIGTAITQFASHEWANLKIDANGKISGDPDSLSRLASLAKIAVKWYAIAAFFIIVGLSIGGYVFFSQSSILNVNWKLPWAFLCFFTGINIFSVAVWSLLEGCNQISGVYSYRLFQGLLCSLAAWCAILFGAELWTASIIPFISLIYAGITLRRNFWEFLKSLFLIKPDGLRLSWLTDILPFQWRIALSWISGYFAFSLFVPVLFHYHGPVEAGQMGLTWSLATALSAVSSAWLLPKIPQFGMMAAQKKYIEMDNLFRQLTLIVTVISLFGAVIICLSVFVLNYYHHVLAQRLLAPLPTALFLAAAVIQSASLPMSIYMRAHKKEPLLYLSTMSGVLIALSTWFLGKYYSALGMAVGYLTIYAVIFPMIIFVWQRFRKYLRLA